MIWDPSTSDWAKVRALLRSARIQRSPTDDAIIAEYIDEAFEIAERNHKQEWAAREAGSTGRAA